MLKTETTFTNLPQWIVQEMVDFLYSNSLVMKNKELTGTTHVPYVVFPTPVKL